MQMDWRALGYQAKYEIVDNNVTIIWENIDAISANEKCGEKREHVI
jgi:hypothetical protein